MCCGKGKSRSKRGKSGKITRSRPLIQRNTSDEPTHSSNTERLQHPVDERSSTEGRVVATPEIQG